MQPAEPPRPLAPASPLPWLALLVATREAGLSRLRVNEWIERLGSPEALFGRRLGEPLPKRAAALFAAGPDRARVARLLAEAAAHGLRIVPRPALPEVVREMPDPPLLLFVRGPLPSGPAVAIVGARRASAASRETAHSFAQSLAAAGVWVVSGLAYGVDAAAHAGALDARGRTSAVLASGLDRATPVGNARLASRILEGGGSWISEHPPGVSALARHFPERNRLISGLSQAVLVVEAREKSGTLWTARHARDQDRDVWAVPGPIQGERYRGSNRLLQDGARVIVDADDMLRELRLDAPPRAHQGVLFETLTAPARRVIEALRQGPRDADALAREAGLSAPEAAEVLLELELGRLVIREGSRVSLALLPGS